MSKPKSNKASGDDLERRVAIYYEAMGYQTSRDVLIKGHQIDLLATRYLPGIGELKVVVEVKSRIGTLGVNEVTPSINTARHLVQGGSAQSMVIVTDATVSRQARQAIDNDHCVKLMTLDDLELHLFNNAESLLRVIRDYENQRIFQSYYALGGKDDDHRQHGDIANYIETWSRSGNGLLMLVGDFGSGKSTIMDRAFYTAARVLSV